MKLAEPAKLHELLSTLAGNAINVQRVFDNHFDKELKQFISDAGVATPLTDAIAPRRLVMETFDIRCQVAFSSERSQAFEVEAFPLNAGYHARYAKRAGRESTLQITIQRAPLPDAASWIGSKI